MPQRIAKIVRLLHSDWSKDPKRRWACGAERTGSGWRAFGPARYHDCSHWLFDGRVAGAGLAGFDFPIGVPAFWAEQVGIARFRDLLVVLEQQGWMQFFEVAEEPEQISLRRPFFPARSRPGVSRASLLHALGAPDMAALLRHCDRGTSDRRPACCLFWTLGGQQVGKAALSGWREVVIPQSRAGARLWPFDGDLRVLADSGCSIIAETYPAEAYGHVGVVFGRGMSKRRQAHRRANADRLLHWARTADVTLDPTLREAISDGFGADRDGEDKFDALVGLAGMIEVVDGNRSDAPRAGEARAVEGWILGQAG